MPATALKITGVVENNNAIGSASWGNINNVKVDDRDTLYAGYPGSYATFGVISQAGPTLNVREARLVVGGIIQGNDLAADEVVQPPFPPAYDTEVYGGSSNLWGLTTTILTPDKLIRDDFGFVIAYAMKTAGGADITISNYLMAKGFGFEIPPDAVITGVELTVYDGRENIGGGSDRTAVYLIQGKVHFTWNMNMRGVSSSYGYLDFVEQLDPEVNQDKQYQYMAYDRGTFKGEWQDVISEPEIIETVNELPGTMTVKLARDLESKKTSFDDLELAGYTAGELLLTDDYDTLSVAYETTLGIGTGTDIDTNHDVEVIEYYGGFEDLLLHTGEALLTHQLEPIQVPRGYPNGRKYFKGYISKYKTVYGEGDTSTEVNLFSHFDELNNEVYQSADTAVIDTILNMPSPASYIGISGAARYPYDINGFSQVFTAPSNMTLARVSAIISRWGFDNDPEAWWPEVTATIRTGSTAGAGTLLATSTIKASKVVPYEQSFAIGSGVALTVSSVYNVTFETSTAKNSSSSPDPVRIYIGAAYSGGLGYSYSNYSASWIDASSDAAMKIWSLGGNTTITHNSTDPSQMLKNVLDYGIIKGSIIGYTPSTIEMSLTSVSAKFNTNTLKEGADAILKYEPADWSLYYNPGELLVYMKSRPVIVTQYFTFQQDIIRLELEKTIERIVNDVYFSGGGSPNLFKHYVDLTSQQTYRKGLRKLSDNRVTDATSAGILGASEINRYKNPIYAGVLEVLRSEHPTKPDPAELVGFRNSGNYIDTLSLQILSIKITAYKYIIQLGLLLPKVSKRVEDIKRNLDLVDMEDNPSAPS